MQASTIRRMEDTDFDQLNSIVLANNTNNATASNVRHHPPPPMPAPCKKKSTDHSYSAVNVLAKQTLQLENESKKPVVTSRLAQIANGTIAMPPSNKEKSGGIFQMLHSSSGHNKDKDRQDDKTGTMFAAAAVAAAAAFTAITATTTQMNSKEENEVQRPRLTWTQYANQRRNSLQRRKIEITKRLEQSTINKRNGGAFNTSTTNPAIAATLDPTAAAAATTTATNLATATNMTASATPFTQQYMSYPQDVEKRTGPLFDFFINKEDNICIRNLKTNSSNEFIKVHKMIEPQFSSKHRYSTFHTGHDYTKLTYDHFEVMEGLKSLVAQNKVQPWDINEVGHDLYDFLVSKNAIILHDEGSFRFNNYSDRMPTSVAVMGAASGGDTGAISNVRRQPKDVRNSLRQQQAINVSKQNEFNHLIACRWDPKWLKNMRKAYCIPLAIVVLIFLIITNTSSNWIRFNDNQRAGLWNICTINKTIKLDYNDKFLKNSNNESLTSTHFLNHLTLATTTTTSLYKTLENNVQKRTRPLKAIGSDLFINQKSGTLVRYVMLSRPPKFFHAKSMNENTLKTAVFTDATAVAADTHSVLKTDHDAHNDRKISRKILDNKSKQTYLNIYNDNDDDGDDEDNNEDEEEDDEETCDAKFLFKQDGHLAVLSLSLVSIAFQLIGIFLLAIGLVSSTSSRALYYYHSAGECLLTSAIFNGLDLVAFIALASSQLDTAYSYGYCFYLNFTLAIIMFFSSLLFYLDDMVNEFKIWKIKIREQDKRESQMFLANNS